MRGLEFPRRRMKKSLAFSNEGPARYATKEAGSGWPSSLAPFSAWAGDAELSQPPARGAVSGWSCPPPDSALPPQRPTPQYGRVIVRECNPNGYELRQS